MIRAALSQVPGVKFISFSLFSLACPCLSHKLTVVSTQLRRSCFLVCLCFFLFLLLLFSGRRTFHPASSAASSSCARNKMRGRGRRVIISHIRLRHHPLLCAAHMHTNHLRGELKHNRGNECKWSCVNFALDLQMELIRRLDTHARPAV